jgi:hypothetical protein
VAAGWDWGTLGGAGAAGPPTEMPMTKPSTMPTTTHQNANLTVLDTSQNTPTTVPFSAPDRMSKS